MPAQNFKSVFVINYHKHPVSFSPSHILQHLTNHQHLLGWG